MEILANGNQQPMGWIQGDPLSGFLFALYLLPLMNLIKMHEHLGVTLNGIKQTDSYYADDTTLIASNMDRAKELYNLVNDHFLYW